MPRDASGVSRVGAFEKLTDPATGRSFTPMTIVDGRVTYAVSDGSTLTTGTRRRTAQELSQEQAFQQEAITAGWPAPPRTLHSPVRSTSAPAQRTPDLRRRGR